MSKEFDTISNDELLEKLGEKRFDAVLAEAGITEDEYILHNDQIRWEVQTRGGKIDAVIAPVRGYDN